MPGRMAQLPKPSLFRQHQRAPTALFAFSSATPNATHLGPTTPQSIPWTNSNLSRPILTCINFGLALCTGISIQKESEGKEDKIFYRSDQFQDGTAVESEVMRQIAPLVPWTDPSTPKGFICKAFANNYSKLNANLIN